jgi:hypothetical protein
MSGHPTRRISLGGQEVDIDLEIAPLIEAMDRAGIVTNRSCQNMDGWVWIQLDEMSDLTTLISAVAVDDDDPDSIFQRLTDWEVAAPYFDESSTTRWRYSISPYPIQEGDEWPALWAFTALVEFPPADLPEVIRRVEAYADLLSEE